MFRSNRRRLGALSSLVAALGALLLTVVPVRAQSSDASPAPKPIEIPEFQNLFIGKTVYFELEDGTLWGREYYVPGSQDAVFVFADGQCFEGYWAKVEDRYCFFYRDEPSCWLTFWEADRIIVVSRDGMRQRVRTIVESEPLSCAPAVTS